MENNISSLIRIRPITVNDYKEVIKWSKDDRFCAANGWEKNRSDGELYQWWLRCVNNVSEDFYRMGIEYNQKLIGYADLAFIKDNTAELGIAIGESSLWGKGLGVHSTRCMIDYAVQKLGITIFKAETHISNFRSRKMLEKVGFKEISRGGLEMYLGVENQLIQYKLTVKG